MTQVKRIHPSQRFGNPPLADRQAKQLAVEGSGGTGGDWRGPRQWPPSIRRATPRPREPRRPLRAKESPRRGSSHHRPLTGRKCPTTLPHGDPEPRDDRPVLPRFPERVSSTSTARKGTGPFTKTSGSNEASKTSARKRTLPGRFETPRYSCVYFVLFHWFPIIIAWPTGRRLALRAARRGESRGGPLLRAARNDRILAFCSIVGPASQADGGRALYARPGYRRACRPDEPRVAGNGVRSPARPGP